MRNYDEDIGKAHKGWTVVTDTVRLPEKVGQGVVRTTCAGSGANSGRCDARGPARIFYVGHFVGLAGLALLAACWQAVDASAPARQMFTRLKAGQPVPITRNSSWQASPGALSRSRPSRPAMLSQPVAAAPPVTDRGALPLGIAQATR